MIGKIKRYLAELFSPEDYTRTIECKTCEATFTASGPDIDFLEMQVDEWMSDHDHDRT